MEGYVEYKKDKRDDNLTLELFSFAAQAAFLAFGSPVDVTGKILESMIQISTNGDK